MDGWNTSFLLGRPIFRCYVSFREGTFSLHGWWDSAFLWSLVTPTFPVWFWDVLTAAAVEILDLGYQYVVRYSYLIDQISYLISYIIFIIMSYIVSYIIWHLISYIYIYHVSYIYNLYVVCQHFPISSNIWFHNSFRFSKRLPRDHGGPSHRSRSGQRPYHPAGRCHRRRPHWRSRPVLHCWGRQGRQGSWLDAPKKWNLTFKTVGWS